MLNDRERKLVMILQHFTSGRKRAPSMQELARKTGWSPNEILKTLLALTDKRFILWHPERHDELQVIQAWEYVPQPEPKPQAQHRKSKNRWESESF